MPFTLRQRLQNAAQTKVVPQTIPVSTTGWNTRDAVTAMPPTDAITLDNWYPDAGGVTVRGGSAVFCTGLGTGFVNTLSEFTALGVRRFVAACDSSVYEISTGSASLLQTGFTSSIWQTVNFNGKMFLVNGVDTPQTYDGATLADSGWTGPTVTDIVGVNVFKHRLFFWLKDDNGFYYGGLDSITGALTRYPLAGLLQYGGDLVTVTTMSHDGGDGIDDLAVFIFSTGEALIFQGTDPSDATAWSLVGRYRIAPPIAIRAVARYGAESYLTTFEDYVPLQQQLVALRLGQIPPRSKASGAVKEAAAANPDPYGWQSLFYPKGRRMIFNVPNTDGTFDQHVYNVSTDAYCRFRGNNAACWGLFGDNLFFGAASGIVYQSDIATTDSGAPIAFDGQCAWNDFGDPRRKRLSAVRPLLQTLGVANIMFGTGFDFEEVPLTTTTTTLSASGSPWDVSPWDTSPWSPETSVDLRWRLAGGTGVNMGYRLAGTTSATLGWLRNDVRFELGRDL